MATDIEKHLLKQLLDGFDSNKLCEIARSVYQGVITVNCREGTYKYENRIIVCNTTVFRYYFYTSINLYL